MGLNAGIPVLLLLLGSLGCRSAAPVPSPLAEELRIYAVADLLGQFDQVPKRGCCVMPTPALTTDIVVFPLSWSTGERGAGQRPPRPEADAARQRSLELRVLAAKMSAEVERAARATDNERSPVLEEPGEALLHHLRSRLADGGHSTVSCILSMRDGSDLVAQGSPGALAVVERALAELR